MASSYKYDFAMVFCPRWGVKVPWTAPAYLIEAVRSRGFSAQYIDFNIYHYYATKISELWTENKYHQFWKTQDLSWFLKRSNLDQISAPVVGFSLTDTNLQLSIAIARALKKRDPNITILFGGHRIFFPEDPEEQVPLDACDAIVKGEGELTLLDILENGLDNNLGTYTPGSDGWQFNGERPLIKDLDMFPWPRYEDVNWELFEDIPAQIMGSRGCINRCSFCNDIVRAQYKYRRRSPEHITEEMLYLKARHGVHTFTFNDPLINGHYPSLDEQCDLLLKHNFNRPWYGNFAIRADMPMDLLRKAQQAGLEKAILGLECASPKVLKLMKKKFTVEEAEYFINRLNEAGILVELNLIVGFPGETEENFQQTLQFLKQVGPKISMITSVATLNVDHSYLWDHLDEYNIDFKPGKDRHISWKTTDGSNTYAVRIDRARRLFQLAEEMNLTHMRFDGDIELKEYALTMDEILARQRIRAAKHYTKKVLTKMGVFTPAKRVMKKLGL